MRTKLVTLWVTRAVSGGIACHQRTAHEKRGNLLRLKDFPRFVEWPERGSNPHGGYPPRDFKSRAYANFAIRPGCGKTLTPS